MRHVLLLTLVAACVLAAGAGARPERVAYTCVAGPDVRFQAGDGTKLVGHVFGTGSKAVVLGHQSQGNHCEWLSYARRLTRLGYTAFAIDFRSHGLSQFRTGAAANRLALDLAAAVKLMRAEGHRKVFLVGASMGGIAVLTAGTTVKPEVTGVISVSGPASFMGMNAVASAPRLRVPVLYVAAEGDDNAGYDFSDDAKEMYAATGAADKRLEILAGRLHGVALVGGSPRAKVLIELFLKRH